MPKKSREIEQSVSTRSTQPFLKSPVRLPPQTADADIWNVVIETPRHSPYKYKYEPRLGAFVLHKVLPEGMSFPYDFGFLPGTHAEDGDPLDVLLFMDEPAFCGCIVPSRLIGVIEARQTEDGKSVRNDRLVAVPQMCRTSNQLHSLKDLNDRRLGEIEDFFKNYNREVGKRFKVLGVHGPQRARHVARTALNGAEPE